MRLQERDTYHVEESEVMVDGEVVQSARNCAEHVFGSAGYLPGVERDSTGNLEALESPPFSFCLYATTVSLCSMPSVTTSRSGGAVSRRWRDS